MLKNLLKTWWILAPDEVAFGKDHTCLLLRRNTEEHGLCSIETSEPLLCYEQDSLQGYLQRCIEARGWDWKCSKHLMYSATIFLVKEKSTVKYKTKSSLVEALLTAYLTALAAQRPITPGKWRHFKGSVMEVVAEASWGSGQYDRGVYVPLYAADLIGKFMMQEDPQKILKLYKQEDLFFYISEFASDFVNRVFYAEHERWARTTEDFLGLVDAKHPEHEGLLRFVEVSGD